MAFDPPWERLPEALARVREATGLSQTEAQTDICRAIAYRAIKIQGALERRINGHRTSKGTVLNGDKFQIPRDLKPTDFDWAASRPLKPWMVPRESFYVPGHWYFDWIELLRSDVTNVLCVPETGGTRAQRVKRKKEKKGRTRPALELAQRAITELYPTGVPAQAEEPNAVLCRKAGRWLTEKGLRNLSDETILRAAGRRK